MGIALGIYHTHAPNAKPGSSVYMYISVSITNIFIVTTSSSYALDYKEPIHEHYRYKCIV